eukprot:TRINITY_DN1015_c0_g1_i12.p1 TRINITY_DN1015_c0_g1~~TRINITY_DN1015_c0_g1_i12.p1  ORF type:complete len:481 (-),score=91.56 TRINITY_DN1015_c0_g1_i12:1081-2523(-)
MEELEWGETDTWIRNALKGIYKDEIEVNDFAISLMDMEVNGDIYNIRVLQSGLNGPRMEDQVRKELRKCIICQSFNSKRKRKNLLRTITATQPWELVSMDIMSLKEVRKECKYIYVFTDHFSRYAIAVAAGSASATKTAELFRKHVITKYGVPKKILSDQGRNFVGKLMHHLCQVLNIEKKMTTTNHAQGNGKTERYNRTLCSMLAKAVKQTGRPFHQLIDDVTFAYNTSEHAAIRESPFFINFGREPQYPSDVEFLPNDNKMNESQRSYISEMVRSLKTAKKIARKVNENYNLRTERTWNDNIPKNQDKFKIGDKVWLQKDHLDKGEVRKLAPKRKGPYTIKEVINDHLVKIKKFKKTFNTNKLIKYVGEDEPKEAICEDDTEELVFLEDGDINQEFVDTESVEVDTNSDEVVEDDNIVLTDKESEESDKTDDEVQELVNTDGLVESTSGNKEDFSSSKEEDSSEKIANNKKRRGSTYC